MQNKKNKLGWLGNKTIIILLFVILLVLIAAPYFLPKFFYLYFLNLGIEASVLGQIGDMFNGITAPILTGLTAILVYITFKEQVHANKLLKIEQSESAIFKQIDFINNYSKEIEEFYNSNNGWNLLINTLTDDNYQVKLEFQEINAHLNKIVYLLNEFSLSLKMVDDYYLAYKSKHDYFYKKIYYLINFKNSFIFKNMFNNIDEMISKLASNKNIDTQTQIQESFTLLNDSKKLISEIFYLLDKQSKLTNIER